VRDVPIEATLRPLLEALKEEAETDRVLRVPPPEDCAELPGKDLRTASVDRPAIHGLDDMVHQLTFYAIRDTHCTWRAVRGDAPVDIMTHAGHRRSRPRSATSISRRRCAPAAGTEHRSPRYQRG
jgi:hypothetical protein